MSTPTPVSKTVQLDLCDEMESANPNVLGPVRFELLVKGIRENGFLQPILVYEQDGRFVVVDGVHRTQAAREVGLKSVPAIIAPDPGRAKILRLALNKLRGELDQQIVGHDLLELSAVFDLDDLQLSGFTSAEVDALMEMVDETDEDDLLSGTNTHVDEVLPPKAYTLTIKFESESGRAKAKEALADNPGDDDATRLANALGITL